MREDLFSGGSTYRKHRIESFESTCEFHDTEKLNAELVKIFLTIKIHVILSYRFK